MFWSITCLSGDGHDQVYAIMGGWDFTSFAPISCRKMYNLWSVPYGAVPIDGGEDVQLKWPYRVCGKCEAEGKFCRFVSNSSTSDRERLECFNPPENVQDMDYEQSDKVPPIEVFKSNCLTLWNSFSDIVVFGTEELILNSKRTSSSTCGNYIANHRRL
ncbi:hypothetical protein RHSIM_Rhsim01G0115300 [Rhododendron simsii]|uniref:Uncharacterized protein n=1 Tax=Rhododendron simsii TaxID=118357 RepID=A0A834HNQ1_RHOSS|nr:hypothetical protein RHSIM_Rhsim01G0115300 [Rhododendron simsii]